MKLEQRLLGSRLPAERRVGGISGEYLFSAHGVVRLRSLQED